MVTSAIVVIFSSFLVIGLLLIHLPLAAKAVSKKSQILTGKKKGIWKTFSEKKWMHLVTHLAYLIALKAEVDSWLQKGFPF
jgi:hypothetical protein